MFENFRVNMIAHKITTKYFQTMVENSLVWPHLLSRRAFIIGSISSHTQQLEFFVCNCGLK